MSTARHKETQIHWDNSKVKIKVQKVKKPKQGNIKTI